ncbi:CRISPR-associated endonuclease Cas2 [candidate division KSB1 bacterium]|nr:CRISPR-associated endonuclease Cas2 [candidate division KSB1 bacterium]
MLILISYDIQKDRTRTRLAKSLKNFGPRVQKSVFEADVKAEELERLLSHLAKVKLETDDSIRLYHLCGECKKKIKIWGSGTVTEDQPFYIA